MVEAELRGLAHHYQVVMNKCQQKRDLCIQCVNYHIGAQEVCQQRVEEGRMFFLLSACKFAGEALCLREVSPPSPPPLPPPPLPPPPLLSV